jgi:mRNA-degrading endonuclease RelE of RelBE toxin-antitoxin system
VSATVHYTSRYERSVTKLLTPAERTAMELAIAEDPRILPRDTGASGVRKARWARQGKGKSGGVRVIFSAAEKKTARKIVEAIKHGKEAKRKAEKRA